LEIVLSTPAHTDVSISKLDVPHPSTACFVSHFGDWAGQKGDYRLPLPDGKELHVKVYEETYNVHWDLESAINNPLGHLFWDAFHWIVIIGAIVFLGLVGLGWWLVSKRKGATGERPAAQ